MHLRDSHDQQPLFSSGLSQIPGLAQAAQSTPPLFLTEDVTLFTCPKASYEYYTGGSPSSYCYHMYYSLKDLILI